MKICAIISQQPFVLPKNILLYYYDKISTPTSHNIFYTLQLKVKYKNNYVCEKKEGIRDNRKRNSATCFSMLTEAKIFKDLYTFTLDKIAFSVPYA